MPCCCGLDGQQLVVGRIPCRKRSRRRIDAGTLVGQRRSGSSPIADRRSYWLRHRANQPRQADFGCPGCTASGLSAPNQRRARARGSAHWLPRDPGRHRRITRSSCSADVAGERIEHRLQLRVDLPGRHVRIGRQLMLIVRQCVLQHWSLRLRATAAEQVGGIAADRASIRIAALGVLRQSRKRLLLFRRKLRTARQQSIGRIGNVRHQRDRWPIWRLRLWSD